MILYVKFSQSTYRVDHLEDLYVDIQIILDLKYISPKQGRRV